MPLTRLPRLSIAGRTVVAGLLTGGILHIVTAFALAKLSETGPYDRLARRLKSNEMQIFAAVTSKTQTMPFQAPDMIYAMCRFDAREGPVTLRATLPGAGWTFAVFSETGENFYTVLGQDGRRFDVAVMLVPGGEQYVPMPRDAAAAPGSILQIPLVVPRGIAIVRAPLPGIAWRASVDADLKRAACQSMKR